MEREQELLEASSHDELLVEHSLFGVSCLPIQDDVVALLLACDGRWPQWVAATVSFQQQPWYYYCCFEKISKLGQQHPKWWCRSEDDQSRRTKDESDHK